ncbi:hypothetical protein [Streptomyces sp. bgisy031]|uniref:hypothetical protein n=1 Tax=Streptomyces sp. bgisy031 TaxID=3413772 RepID=UPI003D744790
MRRCGYAAEACVAALDWFAGMLPGKPVVLAPQAIDVGSMCLAAKLGFIDVKTIRGPRRRAVVRRVVSGHAVRSSSCSTARIRNSTAVLGRSPALLKLVNSSPGGEGRTPPEALPVRVDAATTTPYPPPA